MTEPTIVTPAEPVAPFQVMTEADIDAVREQTERDRSARRRRDMALPGPARTEAWVVIVTNSQNKRTIYGSRQAVGFTSRIAADQCATRLRAQDDSQSVTVERVMPDDGTVRAGRR